MITVPKGRTYLQFLKPTSSVVYCRIGEGCKYAAENLLGNNGIAKGKNDTFYVANALSGQLRVLESQADNTLTLTDVIPLGNSDQHFTRSFNTHWGLQTVA